MAGKGAHAPLSNGRSARARRMASAIAVVAPAVQSASRGMLLMSHHSASFCAAAGAGASCTVGCFVAGAAASFHAASHCRWRGRTSAGSGVSTGASSSSGEEASSVSTPLHSALFCATAGLAAAAGAVLRISALKGSTGGCA